MKIKKVDKESRESESLYQLDAVQTKRIDEPSIDREEISTGTLIP